MSKSFCIILLFHNNLMLKYIYNKLNMRKTMNYRTLDINDFESYNEIRKISLDTYPEAFLSSNEEENSIRKERFYSTIKNEFNFIMGAFDENKLVGIISVIRENRKKANHKAGIYGMFLKPEYQGKGIAKELLDISLKKLFEIKDIQKVNLSVNASNEKAINLYEKSGFNPYGIERNAICIDDKYYDEILMVLFR
jgi:RimJ/RimL family protein N-acetyltransferase